MGYTKSESDVHLAAEPERERWIDISVPLRNAMVHWPSDPPVRIERVLDVERGDSHTLSEIVMGSHSGTHMDAPLHFIEHGIGIDRMPLDITVGRARVIEIQDAESIKPEELLPHKIRRGERILFKTRNSSWAWQTDEFVEDFVFISREAATYLSKIGVRLVGVDYLSVGAFTGEGSQTHRSLLEEGVWIIEGLDLSQLAPGRYYLVCLPLRIQAGDGAPARAILRPLRASEMGQR